ncbi:MAG: IS66 family transposase, partial [Ignavibacteriaceae bacterium]|nr:IS66 family transposase [Ignavibacteriaceae bacterium]
PSSDNPYKKNKKKTKSLRKKGGKVGGQKGHKGSNLNQVNNPDHMVPLSTNTVCDCGHNISNVIVESFDTRQVFDINEIKLNVTEYQAEVKRCPVCGQIHTADFPEEVKSKAQYGPRIKALTLYLKHHGFMSYERIQELCEDWIGIPISQGTLVNFTNACACDLEPVVEDIKDKLIESDIIHCDESGIRIMGTLHWLHVTGNEYFTYYYPHKNRGKVAMDEIGILPNYTGIVIHDHWDSYYKYENCLHSLCNAHHLRELIYFEENDEKWAEKLKKCLIDAKDEKEDIGITKKRIKYYKSRFKRLLNEGLKIHPECKKNKKKRGRQKQSGEHNLLKRLKEKIDDVLRFITNKQVPFDNNSGERDVRMIKVQQKVSGTFRSIAGAENFCIIRSYISTIKKCGYSVYKVFLGVCQKDILLPEVIKN